MRRLKDEEVFKRLFAFFCFFGGLNSVLSNGGVDTYKIERLLRIPYSADDIKPQTH
ncbi:hypothetical protein SDC9_54894 [bioreactor metagenome]|uniref:Uncharacterized protein n=1 Tax=bioreactor metagenome TaxID=1076179 RepID=A0A644WY95_9ZZZZ